MKIPTLPKILLVITLSLGLAIVAFQLDKGNKVSDPISGKENTSLQENYTEPGDAIPQYVFTVLNYVLKYNHAMPGYVGGRTFFNREKKLPVTNTQGIKIMYREWDVHPKTPGKNRGAERLITSNIHTYFYTSDHYKSFQKIEP